MEINEFINKIKDAHIYFSKPNSVDDIDILVLYECDKYVRNFDKKEYLNKIENISDVGLKYLLRAILVESGHNKYCLELYELSAKNGCIIAYWKMAQLYDNNEMFDYDVGKSLYYNYMYYKKTDNLETFVKMLRGDLRESHYCEEFMDGYCSMKTKIDVLQKQNSEQADIIKKLQEHITELEYAPGGIGYEESKNHFENITKK